MYNNALNTWINIPSSLIKYELGDTFGTEIALSSDGRKIYRGVPDYNNKGAIFAYTYNDDNVTISLTSFNTINYNYNKSIWLMGGKEGKHNLIYSYNTINWYNCNLDTLIDYKEIKSSLIKSNITYSQFGNSLTLSRDNNVLYISFIFILYHCNISRVLMIKIYNIKNKKKII
jgi:hypothetical protein